MFYKELFQDSLNNFSGKWCKKLNYYSIYTSAINAIQFVIRSSILNTITIRLIAKLRLCFRVFFTGNTDNYEASSRIFCVFFLPTKL